VKLIDDSLAAFGEDQVVKVDASGSQGTDYKTGRRSTRCRSRFRRHTVFLSDLTLIPKGEYNSRGPCWIPIVAYKTGEKLKPLIKCRCGKVCGIGLHHVHADGTVTRSFYHSTASEFTENGVTYQHEPGCGWHVWLKLADYAEGDFPPVP
jgi:hypothetical protein